MGKLTLEKAERHVCPCCKSSMEKAGCFVTDDAGVTQFRCLLHLDQLIRLLAMPLRIVDTEA